MMLKIIENKFTFVFLLISLIPNYLLAQLTAGEVPLGYTLYESDLTMELENHIAALRYLDLNLDGEKDLKFQILRTSSGNISAGIFPEHDSIGICHIQEPNYVLAKIYEDGVQLACNAPDRFELDSTLIGISLGRYNGGAVGTFPSQVTNQYLHYELKTEIGVREGWIKFSFDLTIDTISLTVHEWISNDDITSTPTPQIENKNPLFPNPVQDGILHIDAERNIKSIEIYNLQGQLLKRESNVENQIQVGEFKGIVVVKLYTEKGEIVEMVLIE